MLIGLTGKYCAGKNFIADLLEKRGLAVLDVDKLGHIAIESRKEAIFARFGNDLQRPDGTVDRQLLGEKVFGVQNELQALQAIVHPEVNRLTIEWVCVQKGGKCVINAALIHKSVFFNQLDCIILVDAPLLVRLMRAKRRDKLPWAVLLKRFYTQRQFIAQYSTGNADIYTIGNSGIERIKCQERRIDAILSALGLKNETI